MNRTQALVLGFFGLAVTGFAVILARAPGVYAQAFPLTPGSPRLAGLVFFLALTAILVLVSVGTVRKWRWIFWLILLAFITGIFRVLYVLLELTGVTAAQGPHWYVLLQGGAGLIQLLIGLAMVSGYRRSGPWGAF